MSERKRIDDALVSWEWLEFRGSISCPCGEKVTIRDIDGVVTCVCGREYRCEVFIEGSETGAVE